jgi:spoIIIJ-associated protein
MSTTEDLIQETLAELLKHIGVTFNRFHIEDIKSSAGEAKGRLLRIDVETDDASLLIGHHGETIYALQQILKTILWNKTGENVFVIVDVDGYRKRQEENVKLIAKQHAEEVIRSGQDERLPPMSSYFRRIVHLYLAETFSNLTTESVGDGDHRQIIVKHKS